MPITRADAASKADNATFTESLTSKPFLFVIGKERKEFHIHAELFAKLSPALNILVNGRMREACEREVHWPDTDTETFVRFAKFAYSHDYAEAEPDILTPDPEAKSVSKQRPVDLTFPEDNEESGSGEDDEEEEDGEEDDGEDDEEDDDDMSSTSVSDDDGDAEDDDEEGDPSEHNNAVDISSTDDESDSDDSSTLSDSQADTDYHIFAFSIKEFIDDYFHAPPAQPPAGYGLDMHRSEGHFGHLQKRRRLSRDYRVDPRLHGKYEAMKQFEAFDLPCIKDPVTHTVAATRWKFRQNNDPFESYRPVFLSHATLYTLADKYGVEDLKALTLRRLHASLMAFTIFRERIPDLVALVYVIYRNTIEKDPARKLIAAFFSCIGKDVRDSPDFRVALRCEGDFAHDVFQEVAKRLD
ncbi:hypothetical protein EDB81DRAFT_258188 [Dactylonectria macrodidyma]|uniref:BTB domain-containing protein n=1 Tax=Dactylonectria macrodidyma TaxID=307937 RepID=A0A9P9FKV3_9HYPO|nr:hypothetical protein EDB81DRAFT_258188 [Dactylonectria macrodidyma]